MAKTAAVKYAPTAGHTVTCTVDSATVELPPGPTLTALTDPRGPDVVFLPVAGVMKPFDATKAGTVA